TPTSMSDSRSLHDALPISKARSGGKADQPGSVFIKPTQANTNPGEESADLVTCQNRPVPHPATVSPGPGTDATRVCRSPSQHARSEEHTSELQSREKRVCR